MSTDSWSLWSYPGPGGRRSRVRSYVTSAAVTLNVTITNYELREDSGYELREDGGKEIRE